MWPTLAILVTAGIIVCVEAPHLVRKRMVKELFIFAALLMFGVTVSVANALRFPLPNPLDGITFLFKPASDVLYRLLK